MTKTVSKSTKVSKSEQWIELVDYCDAYDQPFAFRGPEQVANLIHRWWRRYHPCFGRRDSQ